MPEIGIKIAGLEELRRALRQVDASFGSELGMVNFKAASIVAAEARRRAPKGPHEGGGTVAPISSTISALRTQRAAQVAMGGARSPHAKPTEFGGAIRRYHSSRRTRVPARPFLYPAIAATREQVLALYGLLIQKLMGKAFNQ